MSTDVCADSEGSLLWHSGSDLELNSVSVWLSWVSDSMSVEEPSLVGSVVTVPEDNMSVVGVTLTVDIEALLGVVSDVSELTTIVGNLLVDLSSVWSDDSRLSNVVSSSESVGNCVRSLLSGSDSSGSLVEDKPLLSFSWHVVSDSQLVLA